VSRPRLGFLGAGWIGRHRLQAIRDHGVAQIVAIADPSRDQRAAACKLVPGAVECTHLGQLLELPLDGIVIATPSGLHAEHCTIALRRGLAVFCQKPLARTAAEARTVVDAARVADRLLGLDLSYRHTAAMQHIRTLVHGGGIGKVFSVDLTFHNAYGPEATWFYERAASGGGCVIDLGIHLVDLALWMLGFPEVQSVTSQLHARGKPVRGDEPIVEDHASVQIQLAGGISVRLACSWNLAAGRDCVIQAAFYGSSGGAALRNVDGSFYDFVAERYSGTSTQLLAAPPDEWGGRAAIHWVERLATGARFDHAESERFVDVARVLDAIYGRPA
jgi:predicted dehydrogenase